MNLPASVKILGITYPITYVDRLSDVDLFGREPLLGQVDLLTRTIRILAGERSRDDILQTLLHEVIHAIFAQLHIAASDGEMLCENETVVDLLATGLGLFLQDNSIEFNSLTSALESSSTILLSSSPLRLSPGQSGSALT